MSRVLQPPRLQSKVGVACSADSASKLLAVCTPVHPEHVSLCLSALVPVLLLCQPCGLATRILPCPDVKIQQPRNHPPSPQQRASQHMSTPLTTKPRALCSLGFIMPQQQHCNGQVCGSWPLWKVPYHAANPALRSLLCDACRHCCRAVTSCSPWLNSSSPWSWVHELPLELQALRELPGALLEKWGRLQRIQAQLMVQHHHGGHQPHQRGSAQLTDGPVTNTYALDGAVLRPAHMIAPQPALLDAAVVLSSAGAPPHLSSTGQGAACTAFPPNGHLSCFQPYFQP